MLVVKMGLAANLAWYLHRSSRSVKIRKWEREINKPAQHCVKEEVAEEEIRL
jgi:hypothetical protein